MDLSIIVPLISTEIAILGATVGIVIWIMRELEKRLPKDTYLLFHTDLEKRVLALEKWAAKRNGI